MHESYSSSLSSHLKHHYTSVLFSSSYFYLTKLFSSCLLVSSCLSFLPSLIRIKKSRIVLTESAKNDAAFPSFSSVFFLF